MKKIDFVKMVGAGNDFVIAEELKTNLPVLAREVCQRKTGIGADGLLILERSRSADFRMRIFNPDGSEAEMCGNGARCMSVYLDTKKKVKKNNFVLETKAGLIEARVEKDQALINMGQPRDMNLDMALDIFGRNVRLSSINTGVPHAVMFVEKAMSVDVSGMGREIRYHPKFAPKGTNVNFVEQLEKDFIKV
ncbi:MAG: diaminopimelate epimerase, partial [Candidatus Omnitrophota bacterium]|nr:diaminopimelate epimerase [Candidatus Omnitrophota bacterium]